MLLRTGILSLSPVFCSLVLRGMLRPLSHYHTVILDWMASVSRLRADLGAP